MNPYYNLPPEQRVIQRLADEFNADEQLWRKLESRRQARRKALGTFLSEEELKVVDLAEFAAERRQEECIGQHLVETWGHFPV